VLVACICFAQEYVTLRLKGEIQVVCDVGSSSTGLALLGLYLEYCNLRVCFSD